MTENRFTSADIKKNDTLLPANDGMDIDCFKTFDSVVNPVNLESVFSTFQRVVVMEEQSHTEKTGLHIT